VLRDITEALQYVIKALQKHNGALRSVTKHYEVLWDVTGRYGSVADHYRMLRHSYGAVTEPLPKISILPITN